MPNLVLQILYLMLPVIFANIAPVIVKNRFNNLAIPLDFNKKINNKPIFGKHKTFRGLVFGVIFAIIVIYIQFALYSNDILVDWVIIDYSNWLLLGFLAGLGTIFGDLIGSFIKRRLNYRPGRSFIPFDQLDAPIGVLIFIYPLVRFSLDKIIIMLVLGFVLHITINHLAFILKIKKEKW